jgi:flagellar hook-length control protein FliK
MTAASAVPATAPPKGASPSKGAPEGADGDFAATLTDISTARTATAEGQTKTSDDHAASGQPQGKDACADDAKDGKDATAPATPDAQAVVLATATLTVPAPAPAAAAGTQVADTSSADAVKQDAAASLAAVGPQLASAIAGEQLASATAGERAASASPAGAAEQAAAASLAAVGKQVAPAADQIASAAAKQVAPTAAGQQAAPAPAAPQTATQGAPSAPADAAAQQPVAAPQQQPATTQPPATAPVAPDAAPAVAASAAKAGTTSDDRSAAQQGPQQQAPQVAAPAATPAPAPAAAPHTTAAPQAPAQHTPRLALAGEHVHALLRIASHRGQAQAHLALKPAELGGVEVRLRVTTQGLVASIRADRPDSAQVLQQAGADLRKAFEAAGVDVASVDIGFAGDGAGSRANERQAETATGSRARNGAAQDDELSPIDPDTTTATTTTIALGALVDVLA